MGQLDVYASCNRSPRSSPVAVPSPGRGALSQSRDRPRRIQQAPISVAPSLSELSPSSASPCPQFARDLHHDTAGRTCPSTSCNCPVGSAASCRRTPALPTRFRSSCGYAEEVASLSSPREARALSISHMSQHSSSLRRRRGRPLLPAPTVRQGRASGKGRPCSMEPDEIHPLSGRARPTTRFRKLQKRLVPRARIYLI